MARTLLCAAAGDVYSMLKNPVTRWLVPMLLWVPGCASDKAEPVAQQQSELGAACGFVPQEYIFQDDGCDCPANGDTSCDPDCAEDNQGGRFCGCQFCFGSLNENPETAGQQCGDVPSAVIGQDNGCDCPANG